MKLFMKSFLHSQFSQFLILDDANDEDFLLRKTDQIIESKLQTKSLQDLVQDEEFRDSIFQRFAFLKIPLRERKI